jgi:hypothetical protein
MGMFTKLNPPADAGAMQDAFADLAPESAVRVDAREKRDWFSEFPEEKPAAPARPLRATPAAAPRKSSFFALSESLKDEKV